MNRPPSCITIYAPGPKASGTESRDPTRFNLEPSCCHLTTGSGQAKGGGHLGLENRCAPYGAPGVRIPLAPFVHNVQHGLSSGDPADEWPLAKIRNCESFFATLEGELPPG